MARRFVDLSIRIENEIKSRPAAPEAEHRVPHAQGGPRLWLAKRYEASRPRGLVDGEGYAIEFRQLNTHCGPRMSTRPAFRLTMDRGKPAAKIDEIPLDCFYGRRREASNFRHFRDGHVVSAAEVEARAKPSATSSSRTTS